MHSEDFIKKILDDIDTFNIDDIPNIDLYMDQVTTYLNDKFANTKRHEDDKLMTKTMINNYVKSRLLPSPEKKKYTKDHMMVLIMIYFFKNIISINKHLHCRDSCQHFELTTRRNKKSLMHCSPA